MQIINCRFYRAILWKIIIEYIGRRWFLAESFLVFSFHSILDQQTLQQFHLFFSLIPPLFFHLRRLLLLLNINSYSMEQKKQLE